MSRRSLRIVAACFAVPALGAAAYVFLPASLFPRTSREPSYAEQVQQAKEANAAGLSPEAAAAASTTAAADFRNTFTSLLGFSFGYPDSVKVGASDDPGTGATTVLAQDAVDHVGIQIYARPWGDSGVITPDAVNRDLPQIKAHDFLNVTLDGEPGLAFAAEDPNFGDSLQVWLTHNGYLYQISTYATQGPLLSKVLGTWKWQ